MPAVRTRRGWANPAVRAGWISVSVSALLVAAKFTAWMLTGSSAVFADAAESIVNVIAGTVATISVAVAARPPDADHPYGHGKAESISAAVEGSLILLAASMIIVESLRELIAGPELERLDAGIALVAAAGGANLALGLYLVRVGRREKSEAIEADGRHVLTDVITSVGTVVALLIVLATGTAIVDPLAGLAVAANIVVTGWHVVRRALGGLLDEADFALLEALAAQLEKQRRPEWVEVHQLRHWSSGAFHHFDLHLAVPRYLTIQEAHRIGDELERTLVDLHDGRADAVVHLDPCLPRHCPRCTMPACPVRAAPLESPFRYTVESITRRGAI